MPYLPQFCSDILNELLALIRGRVVIISSRNCLVSFTFFFLPLHIAAQPSPKGPEDRTKAQVTNQVVTDSFEVPRFQDSVRLLLVKEDFAALDEMADGLRRSKARFRGGAWKLFWFYKTVAKVANRSGASDADWQAQLALLNRWVEAKPKSITARISLAQAYVDYAWSARGSGISDTVTEQGWNLFRDRGRQAATILIDAQKLRSKCPHWYFVMHQAALASGANIAQLQSIFGEGTRFEPYYFGYYQQRAIALLPKWYGDEGDSEAFAEETYYKIGGKEGAHIYFEVALSLSDSDDFIPSRFSWPKLQEGFAALEELYGLTQYKVNRFALMATQYGDKQAAAKAFARIGPNWDQSVWSTNARFEAQRSWAGLSPTPEPVQGAPNPGTQNTNRNPFGQVVELLDLADRAGNEGRYDDALRSAKAAMKLAEPLPGDKTLLARAYLVVAQNEQRLGHLVEAQKTLDKAISMVSKESGPESLELAATFVQASIVERTLNNVAKAEDFLRHAIAIREKTNGEMDPELPNELGQLAFLCRTRGRNDEAIETYKRAINLTERSGRALELAPLLEQLGMLYLSTRKSKDAEELFLRSLNITEQRLGVNSPALQAPLSQLVNLYGSIGELDKEKAMQDRLNALQAAQ